MIPRFPFLSFGSHLQASHQLGNCLRTQISQVRSSSFAKAKKVVGEPSILKTSAIDGFKFVLFNVLIATPANAP
jgi:hypothetical protein